MALPDSLIRFTSALPYALRQDIDGYVRTLDAVWREIYAESDVTPDQVHPDKFLFVAGVWRLWGQVDGQRWVVHNSLEVAQRYGANGISAGGFAYSRGSEDANEVRNLHQRFRNWINNNGLEFVTTVSTPRDLLWAVAERERQDAS